MNLVKPGANMRDPQPYEIEAAEKLQVIFADIAGRPLTSEEKARCHQHVATYMASLDQMTTDTRYQKVTSILGKEL